jgi:hypothetical protein
MSPDQPTLPPDPFDARPEVPTVHESAVDPTDAADASPTSAPPAIPASPPAVARAHPGAAAFPPADSTPAEPRRADGARVWRVVRRPRWHERPDAHAPRRDVYFWLSTRRATSPTPHASRPISPDPHAR